MIAISEAATSTPSGAPARAHSSKVEHAEVGDVRIERVIRAATTSDQLQDVLRAAWLLMSVDQRNALMTAAPSVTLLQAGDDFVEVVELRACLVREEGLHRVVMEVTRDGSGAGPQITSLRAFDEEGEIDKVRFATGSALERLALRLDDELLHAMPPQAITPAWVSTIDWDLDTDVLVREVELDSASRHFIPSRWTSASARLDRQELPVCGDPWQEQWRVVMALRPALGRAMPGWAEITLNSTQISALRDDAAIEQHLEQHFEWAMTLPAGSVRVGGAPPGKQGSGEYREPDLNVSTTLGHGTTVALRGFNEEGWPQCSGRVPVQVFVEWIDMTRPGDALFIAETGERVDGEMDRHLFWVDEYHRNVGPALADEQTEFEVERPHG